MQVLILGFGAIEILINTNFRDLRIRYQNYDKILALSVCRVAIIILIRIMHQSFVSPAPMGPGIPGT